MPIFCCIYLIHLSVVIFFRKEAAFDKKLTLTDIQNSATNNTIDTVVVRFKDDRPDEPFNLSKSGDIFTLSAYIIQATKDEDSPVLGWKGVNNMALDQDKALAVQLQDELDADATLSKKSSPYGMGYAPGFVPNEAAEGGGVPNRVGYSVASDGKIIKQEALEVVQGQSNLVGVSVSASDGDILSVWKADKSVADEAVKDSSPKMGCRYFVSMNT